MLIIKMEVKKRRNCIVTYHIPNPMHHPAFNQTNLFKENSDAEISKHSAQIIFSIVVEKHCNQWARFSRPAAKRHLLSQTSPDLVENCRSPVPIHHLTVVYEGEEERWCAIPLKSSIRSIEVLKLYTRQQDAQYNSHCATMRVEGCSDLAI
tara:strand:+ start:1341 stop:1793 length:453 start_codon:yes stop_codon:yes gene_type:complete